MAAGVQARVVIVARDDALAGPLSHGLDRLGWRTVTARGGYAALAALADLQIEAALIDLAGGPEALDLAERMKEACAPRRLPVVAVGQPDASLERRGFDLTLTPPLHPAQVAMRLETFAERGRGLEVIEPPTTPHQVLAIGEPAPQFLALSNALAEHGAEVVG